MTIYETDSYRTALSAYLRTGQPIRLGLKRADPRLYVWRAQQDDRVRRLHRLNDGRIYSWDDPPQTGHPGTAFGCRCQAIEFVPGQTEYAYHDLADHISLLKHRWDNSDFVNHYYNGRGVPVDLADIGHLQEIAEQHGYGDGKEGALRRFSNQIADESRRIRHGKFQLSFENAYDFSNIAFSHGNGVVSGVFEGIISNSGSMLSITGMTSLEFSDLFEDPLDVGIEAGGDPYVISGSWSAFFTAEIKTDAQGSMFGTTEK